MLNTLRKALRAYDMVQKGDCITCAVSGGADSMALLWALYLLRESLGIELHAAHFNHGLRGEESDGDEAFVRQFCPRARYYCLIVSKYFKNISKRCLQNPLFVVQCKEKKYKG